MAKETKLKAGDRLKFKGYEDLPEDMEPLFEAGDILVVKKVEGTADGQTKVKAFREGSDPDVEDTIDTVYIPGEAELATDAPAKAAVKAPAVKGKAKAVAAEPEETEAPVAKRGKAVKAAPVTKGKAVALKETKPAEMAKKLVAKVKAKSKALAVPARTAEEAEQAEITHMPSVRKLIKKGDVLGAAKDLVVQAEQSFFHLGGVLAEIQRTKAFMEAGYNAESKVKVQGKTKVLSPFEQYVNAELGIEYRKAMYLVDIYLQFSKIEGLDEARLAAIGWTKLKLLSRALRQSGEADIESLLDSAEEMTRDDLEEHIKETVVGGKSSGDKVKKVTYKMVAFADEAEYIGAAIERAQEMVEGGDTNAAMKHIFREWAIAGDVEVPMEDAIAALEARYGVKLEIADDTAAPAVTVSKKAAPKAKVTKISDTKAKAKPAKAVAKAGKRKAA